MAQAESTGQRLATVLKLAHALGEALNSRALEAAGLTWIQGLAFL